MPSWAKGVGGVKTYLYNYSPYVSFGSDASAWPMLVDDTYDDYWAQDGWSEGSGNKRQTFAQWTYDAQAFDEKDWPADPVGSTSWYHVLYLSTPNAFTFGWDGSNRDDEAAVFTPNMAQVAGETHSHADQMPGDTNQLESFDYTQAWFGQPGTGNGNWYDFGYSGDAYTVASDTPPNWTINQVWDPNHHLVIRDPAC